MSARAISTGERTVLRSYVLCPSKETFEAADSILRHSGEALEPLRDALSSAQPDHDRWFKYASGLTNYETGAERLIMLSQRAIRLHDCPLEVELLASAVQRARLRPVMAASLGTIVKYAYLVGMSRWMWGGFRHAPGFQARALACILLLFDDSIQETLAALGAKDAFLLHFAQPELSEATYDAVFLSHHSLESKPSLLPLLRQTPPQKFFLDRWALPRSEHNKVFLFRAIWECRRFVALVTPGYFQSTWCAMERAANVVVASVHPEGRSSTTLQLPTGRSWHEHDGFRGILAETSGVRGASRGTPNEPYQPYSPHHAVPRLKDDQVNEIRATYRLAVWDQLLKSVWESRELGNPPIPEDIEPFLPPRKAEASQAEITRLSTLLIHTLARLEGWIVAKVGSRHPEIIFRGVCMTEASRMILDLERCPPANLEVVANHSLLMTSRAPGWTTIGNILDRLGTSWEVLAQWGVPIARLQLLRMSPRRGRRRLLRQRPSPREIIGACLEFNEVYIWTRELDPDSLPAVLLCLSLSQGLCSVICVGEFRQSEWKGLDLQFIPVVSEAELEMIWGLLSEPESKEVIEACSNCRSRTVHFYCRCSECAFTFCNGCMEAASVVAGLAQLDDLLAFKFGLVCPRCASRKIELPVTTVA